MGGFVTYGLTMDDDRSARRFDPWVVAGVATAVVSLIVGAVSALVADSDRASLWTILAVGFVGLAFATRASSGAVVVAALLAGLEVQDPAPWGTWGVAGGLLFLFALRRPRFDAVAAGIVVSVATLTTAYVPRFDGGSGGAFGLVALAAAMVGVGQWVQAQRRYVVAEKGRRQQESERRREEVARHVAEERLRIARELHDSVAHHLAVVSVHTNVARANLLRSPAKAEHALDDVQKATQSVLEELGVVLGVLRASEPEVEPSVPLDARTVDDLVLSFRGIGLQVAIEGLENLPLLTPVASSAARRLLQEALTNAHRYGDGAATVTVAPPVDGYIALSVHNRRASPTPPSIGSGLGLVGMKERVHLLGGRFHAGPRADGFLVTAHLPATAPGSTTEAGR
jgi:signal transduction histidine kinase